jgi:hypothetical protein
MKCFDFDYVVIDEFHHAAAKSYRILRNRWLMLSSLGSLPRLFVVIDRTSSSLLRQRACQAQNSVTGIDSGVLLHTTTLALLTMLTSPSIRHNGITYTIRDLERALVIPARDRAITPNGANTLIRSQP